MALTRRSGQRFQANIWPGFVDAVTALLMVVIFMLSIFMVVQFVLRTTISTQDTELADLSAQVSNLARALGLEQQRAEQLSDSLADERAETTRQAGLIETLRAQSAAQRAEIATQAEALEGFRAQVSSFEEQVAALLAERDDLRGAVAAGEAQAERLLSEQEALQAALATLRDERDAEAEAARLAAAQRDALDALVADLQRDAATREASLQQMLAALSGAARDLAAARAAREAEAAESAALRQRLTEAEADLSAEEQARLAEAAAAQALRERLAGAETALSEQEKARLAQAAAAEALRERLRNADAELTAMTLALEERRREAEDTLTLLAAAEAAEQRLAARLDALATELERRTAELAAAEAGQSAQDATLDELRATLAERSAETEALRARLAEAEAARDDSRSRAENREDALARALARIAALQDDRSAALSAAEERARLLALANTELDRAEASAAASRREVALLNEQTAELRRQVARLQGLLEDSEAREIAQETQIEALGSRLNAALARVAAEERARAELEEQRRREAEARAERLEGYQSEFFGRLREVLGGRPGVRIEGDRFVFDSEVLFAPGSAELSAGGRAQIANVAAVIFDVADDIPDNLNWIIRVDGHTDTVPIPPGGRFADNWELSQERALSVVRYMIDDLGLPPDRLAAAGFGEFQPVNPADTPQARAQNRRIELKLTEQ